MRSQLTAGDRKVLLIAAGVFVALLSLSFVMARGRSSDENVPSVYSTASGGCRAAFLLLRESGYRVDSWERPLADLPAGSGITLILADPASFAIKAEKDKLEGFLRSGGTLIAAGRFAGFYLPVHEAKSVATPNGLWRIIPALSPSPITRAAPEITLAPSLFWSGSGKTVALYGESDNGPAVVQYNFGQGKVLWLAEASPLTNAGLKEKGNLEFFLAAIGDPGANKILWDEYVHGYQQSGAAGKSHPVIGWIALQLGLFAIAILLTYSRRNESVWLPLSERRLSPLEFVRTLGFLYEHANAGGVAVEISYQRFRYLLTHRLGMSSNTSVNDLDRAVRERGAINDPKFAEALTTCESCRYDSRVAPTMALKLIQALFDYAVRLKLVPASEREREGDKKAWKQS